MTHPADQDAARHARIADILAREQVRSQEELADLLERYAGVHVTQATLSRDLDELGIVRLRSGGSLVYALPEEPGGPGSHPGGPGSQCERQGRRGSESPHDARLARYLGELMTSAEASANLVVLRTPAGRRPVPRLGHRPRGPAVGARHHRRRRHGPADRAGPGRRRRPGRRAPCAGPTAAR